MKDRHGTTFLNILGILGSFLIAFGGLFLVQGLLAKEETSLLSGDGQIALRQPEAIESEAFGSFSIGEALPEEELLELTKSLKESEEVWPHEPRQGQLSMVQAIQCCRAWLEDFFMPHLGAADFELAEYTASCCLWTPAARESDGEERPWLSCWTVTLSTQSMEATLILNAVSGQVLDASVSCSSPIEYQNSESLITFLGEYASSFGLTDDYTIVYRNESESGAKKLPYYQSIGTMGICAAIQADSIVVTSPENDTNVLVYRELFNLRLYLLPALPVSP